ncbi:amidohydrolase family protein [Caulobacter segnis]
MGRRADPGRRCAAMLKKQAANTPPPQWVRVVGGFTEHQFVEKRLPTLDEINAAAPETPVFILHLYDRALLNRAAPARRRLHQGHAQSAGRRDSAGRLGRADRPAAGPAERDDPLRHPGQGSQACRPNTS